MREPDKTKIAVDPKQLQSILIVNLGGIGDFILSLPALKGLRNAFKDARIVLLTTPRTAVFAASYPYLNEVLPFDCNLLTALPRLIELRQRRFDLALNMRSIVSRTSAYKMAGLFYFIRPRYKVGRDTEGRGFFFDLKIPEEAIGDLPEYEYDLKAVRALGVKAEYSLPEIPISEAGISYVDQFLALNNVAGDDIIVGVNPGAPYPAKRWPPENFAKVIDILNAQLACKIILTGSRDELEIAESVRRRAKSKVIIAVGKTSLKQLAALIKRCNVYITNDTGAMHIAAVLKTPLVAIFGPGYLPRFDPRNISEKATVFYRKAPCAPCDRPACASMQCLKAVLAEEVAEAAIEFLK